MSEHSQALHIANRWLDFKMNALVQMVPGDPDCDACVLARQFIRTEDHLAVFMKSNAELTVEIARLRVERDGWITSHDNRQAEVEQACAELVRIRDCIGRKDNEIELRDIEIDRLCTELNQGRTDELARLRRELDASEKGHKKAREAQLMDYQECQRLRREKEALVEALKFSFMWMKYPLKPPLQSEVEIIDAALRSATETKSACQADFSPCTFPTCACSATETKGEPT